MFAEQTSGARAPLCEVTFTGIGAIYCRVDLGNFIIQPFKVTATPATISKFLSNIRSARKPCPCFRLTVGKNIRIIYESDVAKPIKIGTTEWYAYLTISDTTILLERMKWHLAGFERADEVDENFLESEPESFEKAKETQSLPGPPSDWKEIVDKILFRIHLDHQADFIYLQDADRPILFGGADNKVYAKHLMYYNKADVEAFNPDIGLRLTYIGTDPKELVSWIAKTDKVVSCFAGVSLPLVESAKQTCVVTLIPKMV